MPSPAPDASAPSPASPAGLPVSRDDAPLPIEGFRGTPEEIERQWFDQVYRGRGDSMPIKAQVPRLM